PIHAIAILTLHDALPIFMDNKKCTVELIYNGQRRQMECLKGSNLMELLQKNKVYIEAICGGKGICGKCKIKIESGILSELTSEEDRKSTRLNSSHVKISY